MSSKKAYLVVSWLNNLLYFSIIPFLALLVSKLFDLELSTAGQLVGASGMVGSFSAIFIGLIVNVSRLPYVLITLSFASIATFMLWALSLDPNPIPLFLIAILLLSLKFTMNIFAIQHRTIFLSAYDKKDVLTILKVVVAITSSVAPLLYGFSLKFSIQNFLFLFASICYLIILVMYVNGLHRSVDFISFFLPRQAAVSLDILKNNKELSFSIVLYMVLCSSVYFYVPALVDGKYIFGINAFSCFISVNAIAIVFIKFYGDGIVGRLNSRKGYFLLTLFVVVLLAPPFIENAFGLLLLAFVFSIFELTFGIYANAKFLGDNENELQSRLVLFRLLSTVIGIELGIFLSSIFFSFNNGIVAYVFFVFVACVFNIINRYSFLTRERLI